jgi:cellulose synthase/poly-beta-1,6-N-acetylglucosamine synthase-like glycosyltransferase
MKVSLIITAWKEAESVAFLFDRVLDPQYGNLIPEMEIILACPDSETYESAQRIVEKYNFKNFIYVKDPQKGKPTGLNMAMKASSSEIMIMTDGDVYPGVNALPELVKPFEDKSVGGVTGRPVSADSRKKLLGYYGHLLADAAHHKRTEKFSNGGYYFMSGYLMAIRKVELKMPNDVLSDDAWITNRLVELGYKIKYSPKSEVFVKYPKTFADWYKQKTRSVGGYSQLKNFNIVEKQDRKIYHELKYIFFPFTHIRNPRELIFLSIVYPARLLLWFRIWWNRYVSKKNFEKIWVRIESTK